MRDRSWGREGIERKERGKEIDESEGRGEIERKGVHGE